MVAWERRSRIQGLIEEGIIHSIVNPEVRGLGHLLTGIIRGHHASLSEVFCLEGFVRGGFCQFPLLSEYIC